jgi:hypothetical protein
MRPMGTNNHTWAQLAAADPSKHDATEGTNNNEETITSPTKTQTVQAPVIKITDETNEAISSAMEMSSITQPIPQTNTYKADEEDDKETTFVLGR